MERSEGAGFLRRVSALWMVQVRASESKGRVFGGRLSGISEASQWAVRLGQTGCQPGAGGTDEEHAERIGQILLGRLARESVRVLWLARSPDAHHPRPPTQPVHATPSVRSRPVEASTKCRHL